MAKIELSCYATKSNRKRLINAFSDKSPVCGILWLPEETQIVSFADNNKVLAVDTAVIPLKSTKSTQGVQVMKLTRKGAKMTRLLTAYDSQMTDIKHYLAKNIPAAGSFLRSDDIPDNQLSMF